MKWEKLAYTDFDDIDRATPVLLNIGAVEQHGPHLPLDVDCRIGQLFCDHVDTAMAEAVLTLPQVKVCCSRHHMDFAGTLSVSHETLLAYLKDMIGSITAHGFKNILILNSHGGNQAIGRVCVEVMGPLLAAQSGRIAFTSWWDVASEALVKLNESGQFGVGHACEFETSLMQMMAPDEVRMEAIPGKSFVPHAAWADGDLLRSSPVLLYRSMEQISGGNGVVGDPSAASPQKGQAILDLVVPELVTILRELSQR